MAAFARAFNAHDAAAISALFYEEAELVGSDGTSTRGRNEIAAMFAASFEALPELTVEPTVTAARALTPEVVRVEGSSRMSGASPSAQHTNFDALLVRKDGAWKIAELRDTPQPEADVPSYERLRDLEWMVGDWVSPGDEVKVSSSVKWAENKSFLVRTYKVELPSRGRPPAPCSSAGPRGRPDQVVGVRLRGATARACGAALRTRRGSSTPRA
ncbi:MAG: SgcJ/EcaC family oxidoreductase [Isosphaeraceae bacterium]